MLAYFHPAHASFDFFLTVLANLEVKVAVQLRRAAISMDFI